MSKSDFAFRMVSIACVLFIAFKIGETGWYAIGQLLETGDPTGFFLPVILVWVLAWGLTGEFFFKRGN